MNLARVPEIHVSIGELKAGQGNDILMASLGSCVGIALLWKKRGLFALGHCLLPFPPPASPAPEKTGARFVSHAVPNLLNLIGAASRADHRQIEAVIAGGGNMTAPLGTDPANLIGSLNARAAEEHLAAAGIHVRHRELGGETGRKIYVFCENAEVKIKTIPRILAGKD